MRYLGGPIMHAMNKKEIAMRIRQLREERGLRQEDVAGVLGIKQPAYCDLENGSTTFTAVAMDKLAEFYGLSLDEFLRPGQPVLNMHDHSSNGFNAYHMQHRHGMSEEVTKRFLEVLDANARALEKLAEVLGKR
jgi:transcriptional regulator with XRE-family HTH domain